MKNKTLKKTLLISTGLLAAGGICIGIGIAMGGSPVFYLDNEGIHLKETTACPETVQDYSGQKQLAAFEKIEVDLKYGEFSLEEGDSYSVEYLLAVSMASAPSSSIKNVPRKMNRVRRTIPPTFGAEIASCMVLRCIREIFRPDNSANDAATVMTPSPPIWISTRMIVCPKPDQ